MKRKIIYSWLLMLGFLLHGCRTSQNGFNVFSLNDDLTLGKQVVDEIEKDPKTQLMDSVSNTALYQYIYAVRDTLLQSGEIRHRNDFPWRIRVIKNDSIINAFCTPGGYIYLYTGILKFLDSEDQLAGVLGHEMGHADLRHSTQQITKMFGVQLLLTVIAGDKSAVKDISAALIGLSFSRKHEKEADQCSVSYLCSSTYCADAGGKFFEKIIGSGMETPPVILSTHPDPGDRVEAYTNYKQTLGCSGNTTYKERYQKMLELLP